MHFQETKLKGAFVIDATPHLDERGFFARSFCAREFSDHGLNPKVVQCNVSFNRTRGTLRGMHYQVAPFQEAKLVRCSRGALYDVIVDLRPASPTYLQWVGAELRDEAGAVSRMMYVPEGFGHGFQTLEDDTEIVYQMSEFYAPGSARGFRWDDPTFAIEWPLPVSIMSEADRNNPLFTQRVPVRS